MNEMKKQSINKIDCYDLSGLAVIGSPHFVRDDRYLLFLFFIIFVYFKQQL